MKHCLFFLLLLSTSGCGKSVRPSYFQDRREAISYIKDPANSLVRTVEAADGTRIDAYFLPVDLFVGRSRGSDTLIGRSSAYLLLDFSREGRELIGPGGSESYSALLQTLSFGMDSLVRVHNRNGDPLRPLGAFFQPTYNMSRSNEVLVVFPSADLYRQQIVTVALKDFGLGIGDSEFVFDPEDIRYISSVQISNPD